MLCIWDINYTIDTVFRVTAAGGCTLKAASSELKRDRHKVPTYSTYYVCYT